MARLASPRPTPRSFAAKNDMVEFPARESQTKIIEAMIELNAGNSDAEITDRGEIGLFQPAPGILLPEEDIAVAAVERPPAANAPL